MNLPPSLARMRPFAPLALVLASTAIAIAAYLQALDYPFVYDDIGYIAENTKLADLRLAELWRLFTEPYNDYSEFLPLRELSYWFDMALFGMNPSAFRAHNILLYLLCLPLVYGTTLGVWRYFRPAAAASAPWAAAAATALFALHPSHAEAVVWISGRKDVQAALFSLLALWLAVRAKREQGLSAPYAATAIVALLAAMLSKATAVAVAPVIIMLWVSFWRDIPAPNRRHSLLLWPLASLLLPACIALVFAAITTQRNPLYFGIEAVTRTLAVLGWLVRLAVSPESRHFFYPLFEDPYLSVMVALGVAVLAAAMAGGVMFMRRRSLDGFALLAFLLLCMPSMQLIPYSPPSLVSDRFVFLAVWPAILLIVALSWHLKPVPRIALLLAFALPWSFQTLERPRDWRSFEVMVDTDLRAYPGYYMPAVYVINNQLKDWLFLDAGKTANGIATPEIRNIMAGLVYVAYAVHIKTEKTGNPDEAVALLQNYGLMLKQRPAQAKWNSSIDWVWRYCQNKYSLQWEYLVKEFPDDVSVRYNAGLSLLTAHVDEEAVAHLRIATESQRLPESVRGQAFRNLGLALMNSGHIVEAEAPLRAALGQSQPDLRAYCLLSEVYKQAKRYDEAARAEAACPGAPNGGTVQ